MVCSVVNWLIESRWVLAWLSAYEVMKSFFFKKGKKKKDDKFVYFYHVACYLLLEKFF